MARLLLDNLEDDLTLKLAQRAAEHERSVEDEARDILRAAVGGGAKAEPGSDAQRDQAQQAPGLGTQIATLFASVDHEGEDFVIEELRGGPPRTVRFD